MPIDKQTQKLFEANEELIQERVAGFDKTLESFPVLVRITLPEKFENDGGSIPTATTSIKINLAERAKDFFEKGVDIPELLLVTGISVEHAFHNNDRGTAVSVSAQNEDGGRFMVSDEPGAPPINKGTFLVLGNNTSVSKLEKVYDASKFVKPGGLCSKYSDALLFPYESRIAKVPGSPNVIYQALFTTSKAIVHEDTEGDGEFLSKEASTKPRLRQPDWFLRLIHNNLDIMTNAPVATIKPGDNFEEVNLIDIHQSDMERLKKSAHEQIYAPLRKHLISTNPSGQPGDDGCFTINVTAQSDGSPGAQKWPNKTNLEMLLKFDVSHFNR